MTAITLPNRQPPPFAIGSDEWRLLVFVAFAVSAVLFFVIYQPWNLTTGFMVGAPVGRDFANFWAGGRLALDGRLDLLADLHGYNEFINATLHRNNPLDERVFSYAPNILPFLVPFGAMPIIPAAFLWTGLNVWLIDRAARLLAPNTPALRLAACLSPAVVTMVAFGHFGGVLAFLATYALTRADSRPLLAGICLGLISVKPQFAVALGVFLLLTGRWRAVLWSVPAAVGLIGLSLAAFGLKPWVNFVQWTMPFHSAVLTTYVHQVLRVVVSVYAAARLIGLSATVGYAAQCLFGMVVLIGSAALVLQRGMTPRTVALALLSAFAALPYFATYDLAVVAPALAVALFDDAPGGTRPFLPLVPASLFLLAPVYAPTFDMFSLPVGSLVIAGVLLFALWRETGARPAADSPAAGSGDSSCHPDAAAAKPS